MSTGVPASIIIHNTAQCNVSHAETRLIACACGIMLTEVAAVWNFGTNYNVRAAVDTQPEDWAASANFFIVRSTEVVVDAMSVYPPNTLVRGIIYSDPILKNGGAVLRSGQEPKPTVSAAVFRAIVNVVTNPSGNSWWHDTANNDLVLMRVCDPVAGTKPLSVVVDVEIPPEADPAGTNSSSAASQSSTSPPVIEEVSDKELPALVNEENKVEVEVTGAPVVEKRVEKISVELCNFILPAWAIPDAPSGTRFDYSGVLTEPFQIGTGSWCVKMTKGLNDGPAHVFHRLVPGWQRRIPQ